MGVLRQAGTLLFVTAAYVVIDTEEWTLLYGQAGHPTGFILRAAGELELLPAGDDVAGPALGLIDDCTYLSGRAEMSAGDRALLFTDGVFEVRNAAGEEWGTERLGAEICRRAGGRDLLPGVASAAAIFAAGGAFDDDVCLISLEALP
jgi:sigma-B regulation protein RsbU (phosphoserine phosphatase)